jgi:hypothetical protein
MKISKKKLIEIIKKIGSKYIVYPKKGGKRLGTHATKKKALNQLASIEISKSKNESIDESYVRRYKYINQSDKSSVKFEDIKSPANLNINILKALFEKYYEESEEEIISSKDPLALTKTITNFAKRRQIQNYYNSLDSDELYSLQTQIYKSGRNKLLHFVNSVLEANPATRSDYPGNKQLVDATRRSKLVLTPNDLPEAENITNFDAMPFKSVLRVANDSQTDITGMPKGSISYDKYGVRVEEKLENTKYSDYDHKTDPKQGEDIPKKFVEFMPTGAV